MIICTYYNTLIIHTLDQKEKTTEILTLNFTLRLNEISQTNIDGAQKATKISGKGEKTLFDH